MHSIKIFYKPVNTAVANIIASTVRKVHSCNMDLKQVVDILEMLAPVKHAENWDNVGLLVEPSRPHQVNIIMLTNDLTEVVMEECINKKVDLLISYHPPIFTPIKTLIGAVWKQRILVKAIENRIAIYSPHTAWDAVPGGVNDWLVSGLGEVLFSKPVINDQYSTESAADLLDESKQSESKSIGPGRICKLLFSTPLENLVKKIKTHLSISNVRVAFGKGCCLQSPVQTIALCAGSGSSVLQGVAADVYITGEMSHHQVLDAVSCGTTVVLCEHSNTERGYLPIFKDKLQSNLNCKNVQIVVSQKDSEPLVVH